MKSISALKHSKRENQKDCFA